MYGLNSRANICIHLPHEILHIYIKWASWVALVVKNPHAKAGHLGDVAWIPGLGTSRGGGRGNPLQYSCLENPMDRGAWLATAHSVTNSQTRLKQLSTHAHTI